MADEQHITQSSPRTGATPADQTASQNGGGVNNGPANGSQMLESDKQIYDIVKQSVDFAGEQFNENLSFNSTVLTNVLYDNIYELLGEKFNEDEFVEYVVEELLKNGCVIQTTTDVKQESKTNEVIKEEIVVTELDTTAYDDLVQKVYASIELVKTNKLTIFKLFASIDEQQQKNTSQLEQLNQTQLKKRDEEIQALVKKLESNGTRIQDFITSQSSYKTLMEEQLGKLSTTMNDKVTSINQPKDKSSKLVTSSIDNANGVLKKIDKENDTSPKTQEKTGVDDVVTISRKDYDELVNQTKLITSNKKKIPTLKRNKGIESENGENNTKLGSVIPKSQNINKIGLKTRGKRKPNKFNKLLKDNKKHKKPGLFKRIGGKIKRGVSSVGSKLKNKISNSFIGKSWRGVKNAAKKVWGGVKKVWGGIKKVGKAIWKTAKFVYRAVKKTIKAVYKATKFVAKAFIKTAKFVGKAVVKGAQAGYKFIKRAIETKGRSLISGPSMLASAITKIGWSAIKFVGKKLWQGIKKLAFAALKALGKLFGIGVGFVNTIAFYSGKLLSGIKDKTYKWLVKPIASMLVTVFGFTMNMVMAPVNFMKWLATTVFERIQDCLSSIAQGVKRVLKSTWSIFKKILFNPITIALLIGGIFFFFGKRLLGWLSKGVDGVKESIIPKIKHYASVALNFLKAAWDVIVSVGGFIFKCIEWITNPKGLLAGAIRFIIKTIFTVKKWIKKLIGSSGKDSVETFCMFLAGDYIGLAIRACWGGIKKFWKWFKTTKLMRGILNIFDSVVGYFKMWGKVVKNIWSAITGFNIFHPIDSANHIFKCVSNSIDAVSEWVSMLKNIWSPSYNSTEILVDENPAEVGDEKASGASIAVRNLKMKGTNSEKVLKRADELVKRWSGGKSVIEMLEKMTKLQNRNNEYVQQYQRFIAEVWELGKGNDEVSYKALKALLESPEMSEKLLQALYLYNPQNGQLMSVIPQGAIGGILQNIRKMVLNDDMTWEEKFKQVVKLFEQLNMERSYLVNKQGDTIKTFAEQLGKFDLNQKNASSELLFLTNALKKDQFFTAHNMPLGEVAARLQSREGAVTQQVKSVTGEKLGTNELFKGVQGLINEADSGKVPIKVNDDFKVQNPSQDKSKKAQDDRTIGNVVLSEKDYPAPEPDKFQEEDGKSMYQRWQEHQAKRTEMFMKQIPEEKIDEAGFQAMTYDMFKQKYEKEHPPSKEQLKKSAEIKERRMRGIRLASDIKAYHNQGKEASLSGFVIGSKPSIMSIPMDGLGQWLYLFSPEWQKVQGASKISDDEILLMMNSQDAEAAARIRKAKEAEMAKKAAEEKERRREQQILDYSAKVNDGYIEVKIGEDVEAMKDAWEVHQAKRSELFAQGIAEEKIDEMGYKVYDWSSWVKFYRKTHGLPEDGIQRIKFDGQRKKREINWDPRPALSKEELAKYGIEVSEDGPVMIPLDKALTVANSLLSEAKSIYTIRDGLEVMKQGLDEGTQKLKNKREGGVPISVVASETGGESSDNVIAPPGNQQSTPQL